MIPFKEIYDLSQPVYDKCPGWPTHEMPDVTYEDIYHKDQVNTEIITLNTHTGTHLDAPFHFDPSGRTIYQLPVEWFQGNAILVDLRGQLGLAEGITVAHLAPYADKIAPGDIVLLCTGWGPKRGFTDEWYKDWPYLTGEGAQWLKDKGVKGVGTDGMSMGGWYEGTGRPCHEILLPAEIWILEEILIPDALMEHENCYLMAFPIKWQGFSGAPARAVAMVL